MRILLVDDHPFVVEGLRTLLERRGFQVIGTARDGDEAIERARALRPELILMDIHMPNIDGLAALRVIKTELPETKIVMLTVSETDDELFQAINAGACGYLLKNLDIEKFFSLLKEVARGEVALAPGLAAKILREFERRSATAPPLGDQDGQRLSARELEVLTLVAGGLTYREVGAKLCLSTRTIKYHMGQVIARLHLENRIQAIRYARQTGLVR